MGEERRLAIEADLAGNRSVGRDAAIAEGDEAEVNDGGEAVPEDPREVVDDEAGAERAQRLVIDRHRDPPSGARRRGEGEQYEGQDEDSRKNSRGGRTRTTSHGASGERKRELKAPPFFFWCRGLANVRVVDRIDRSRDRYALAPFGGERKETEEEMLLDHLLSWKAAFSQVRLRGRQVFKKRAWLHVRPANRIE